MSRFPASFRKTMWRKMSAGAQLNALGATHAMMLPDKADAMAILRGIPENPVWLKSKPTMADVEFLGRRVLRRMHSERAHAAQREAAKKACVHTFIVTPGVATKACSKCGRVEAA